MKIFIGNLGDTITTRDIFLLFSSFGKVTAANVAQDDAGNSRKFGYVIMTEHTEAEVAISTLNKKIFKGQFLAVSESIYSEKYSNKVTMPVM